MVETTTLKEVYPPSGHVQRLYCDVCEGHLDLAFADYRNIVSGVDISIKGLPVLRCENCSKDYLPDHSRFAIIRHHELATLRGSNAVRVTRKPLEKTFPLTKVPFLYDADDYYYIPGLSREWDDGFLTPVFFNEKGSAQIRLGSRVQGVLRVHHIRHDRHGKCLHLLWH